jgi:hypothetical protein
MHHRALGDEEVYRICVGDDDSTRYYLDRFENFDLGGGPASWNWMAFWASFIWLVHRRMFWYAAGYVTVLPLFLLSFNWAMTQVLGESAGTFFEASAAVVIFWVLVPMFANVVYYRRVNARIEKARATTSSREEMIETLSRQRPITHPLIVLLICGGFVGAVFAANFAAEFYGSTSQFFGSTIRKQVAESIKLAHPVQRAVARAYATSKELPTDLAAAGLNDADYQSESVAAINVIDGMVLIVYSNKAHPKIAKKTLSFRPVLLDGGGIAWNCGYFQSSERDTVYGTNIDAEYLPSACQATAP